MRKTVAATTAAVGAAVVSALCCVGPLVAVFLGLSGAGLAGTFEPLRPYFAAGAGIALAAGHAGLYREDRKACQPGALCADARTRRRMRVVLWIATAVAAAFVTFPYWSRFAF